MIYVTWSYVILSPQLCTLTVSIPHFFIAEIESKVSQLLLPSFIILKICFKCLTPKEPRKLLLTHFNLENILSSLALETGTVNDNLIINSTWLQPLPLGVVKILCHVTGLETMMGEKVIFKEYCIFYWFGPLFKKKKIRNRHLHPSFF